MPPVLWWARVVVEAARVELRRGLHAQLISGAVLSPLAGGVYILMARYLGRMDLAPFVVLAPILSGLWGTAMTSSGTAISQERDEGTLELLIAAPAPAALVPLGRVIAATIESLIAIPLTLIVATLLGVPLTIAEPVLFVVALVALVFATAAVGLVFSGIFVLARSTNLFTNVINWPIWILSGTAFPIALLPVAVQPLSAFVALAWAAAVLRGAATGIGSTWWIGLAALVALGLVYFGIAARLFVGVERRVRADGSLASF